MRRTELGAVFPYPSSLRLLQVSHTYRQLTELTQQIRLDLPLLRADGIEVNTWGPDVKANRVTVQVQRADQATISFLNDRYGGSVIEVTQGGPAHLVVGGPHPSPPVSLFALGAAFAGAGMAVGYLAVRKRMRIPAIRPLRRPS